VSVSSTIEGLKKYLLTYMELETDAPVWVGYLGAIPTQYSIFPMPGDKIIETYVDGSSLREFPFSFQSVESTSDELTRMDSIGFFEEFGQWLEDQSNLGVLPELPTGKTAVEIKATNWGFLYEQGQSDSGIYQISAKLIFEQQP